MTQIFENVQIKFVEGSFQKIGDMIGLKRPYGLFKKTISLKFFKVYLSQVFLGPFFSTLM